MEFRTLTRLGAGGIIPILALLILVLFLAATRFLFSSSNQIDLLNEETASQDTGNTHYALEINSIDHNRNTIELSMMRLAPDSEFNHAFFEFLSNGLQDTLVLRLNDKYKADPGTYELDEGIDFHEVDGFISFDSQIFWYPFDKINVYGQVFDNKQDPRKDVDRRHAMDLSVANNAKDFFLVPYAMVKLDNGVSYFKFSLVRSGFLKFLALFLLVLLAISSVIVVLEEATGKSSNTSFLAYFIGIWGVRGILLEPVVGYKPFPVIVDVVIIGAVLWTVLSIGLIRLFRVQPRTSGGNRSETH